MTDTIATAFIAEAMSKGFDKLGQEFMKLSETEQRAVLDMMEAEARATAKMQSEMERRVAIVTQKNAEIQRQYDYTAQSALKVGAAFGGVAAAGMAFLGSATQLAARVETLGVVTTRIGANLGMTETQVRDLEKSIQKLGITTQGSRQAIAMMAQANLDLSRATELARLAQDAAVVTGENSTETFQQLVYAISSGSVVMLRRMMLSADFEGAYLREARAVGKTTAELTEAEKVQIRMNEVLKRGENISGVYGAAMETAGKKITSLQRHVEEARVSIGEAFLPAYADAIDVVTDSLKAWNNLDSEVKTNIATAGGYVTAIAAVESGVFLAIGTIMKMTASLKAANAAMTILGVGAGSAAALIVLPVTAMVMAAAKAYSLNKELEYNRTIFADVEEAALGAGQSYEEFAKAARDAAEAAGLVEVNGQFREKLPGRSMNAGNIGGFRAPTAEGVLPTLPTAEEYNLKASSIALEKTEGMFRQWRKSQYNEEQAHTAKLNEEYQNRTNAFRAAAAEQARWNAIGAEAMKAMAQEELAVLTMEAGLAAGVRGTLQQVTEQYTSTIEDLRWQEGELIEDIALANKKYGEGSEKVADLTHKLDENRQKQVEAAEAIAEATAQMIYQQAAAGLDAGAALELARAMGVLSEQDYAVASTIQNLRNQFDENRDGMIDASEGAETYAARVAEVNNIVGALQAAGLDVTAENIAKGMQAIEETGMAITPEWMEQLVAGEPAIIEKLSKVEGGIINIGTSAETTAKTADEKFGAIDLAAGTTEEAMAAVKTQVDELKTSLDLLPTEKTITITVNYQGDTSRLGGAPEGQHGLNFIVPPGFNRDNFPVFVSSGERVIVQTKSQQMHGEVVNGVAGSLQVSPGNASVDIYNFNNYSRSAVSHSMALVRAAKAKRLNQSMGSPV